MPVNASAHRVYVEVGSDSQSWSNEFTEFEGSVQQRDETGLLLVTGKVNLGVSRTIPDSVNARTVAGRSRWFKGQLIKVDVTNTTDTRVRHPFGYQYLLKPPLPAHAGKQSLELELGCILKLRSFAAPDEIVGKVEPASLLLPRAHAIRFCLQKAGIPNDQISLNDGDFQYPIPCEVSKQGGSWVELAGKLAFGGMRMLYQNNQGIVISLPLAIAPSTPVVSIEQGKGEISYEPVDGGETPAEVVKWVGVWRQTLRQGGLTVTRSIEYAPAQVVDSSLGAAPIVVKDTTIRTTLSEGNPGKKEEVTVLVPRGLINPDIFPKDVSLGLDRLSLTEHLYDGDKQGKLRTIARHEYRLGAGALVDYLALQDDQTLKRSLGNERIKSLSSATVYQYRQDDIGTTITTETQELAGAIVVNEADLSNPTQLISSDRTTVKYAESGKANWTKTETILSPLAKVKPDLNIEGLTLQSRYDTKIALITKEETVESSNSGQTTPPAAERRPSLTTEEETQVSGSATFVNNANPNQERTRTYTLDVGVVDVDRTGSPTQTFQPGKVNVPVQSVQLTALALISGAMLVGRSLGQSIQIPLLDSLLTNPLPLTQWNVLEFEFSPSGYRYNWVSFQADGIAYTHDIDRAIAGCHGIWLGTIEGIWQAWDAAPILPTYLGSAIAPPFDAVDPGIVAPDAAVIINPAIVVHNVALGYGYGITFEIPLYINLQPFGVTLGYGYGITLEFITPAFTIELGYGYGITFEITAPEIVLGDAGITVKVDGFTATAIAPVTVGSADITVNVDGFTVTSPPLILGIADLITLANGFTAAAIGNMAVASAGLNVGTDGFTTPAIATFTYSSDGDTNDVLNFIGKDYDAGGTWTNPHTAGRITVVYSSNAGFGTAPENLVNRAIDSANFTDSIANSYFQIDFGSGKQITPNKYSIQHSSQSGYHLRNWRLQGSNNGSSWTDLDTRTGDTTINAADAWGTWDVTGSSAYRYLRVEQTGLNSNGDDYLVFGEFQVYGSFSY